MLPSQKIIEKTYQTVLKAIGQDFIVNGSQSEIERGINHEKHKYIGLPYSSSIKPEDILTNEAGENFQITNTEIQKKYGHSRCLKAYYK